MKLDFWRALGVGAISILVWTLLAIFVYVPGGQIEAADYLMLAFSAIILVVVSYLYFRGSAVVPSVETGFYLALTMLAYNFLYSAISGIAAAQQGLPEPLPPPSALVTVLSFAIGLGTPTLVGWYLGRKR